MQKPCHEPEDYIYHEFVEPMEDVDVDDIDQEDLDNLIGYLDEDGIYYPPSEDPNVFV